MKTTQLLLPAPRTLNMTNIRDRVFASRYSQDGAFVSFRPAYTGRYYSGKALGVSPFDDHSPKGSDVATYNNYYSFIQKFEKEQKAIRSAKRYARIAKKAGYKSYEAMIAGEKKKATKAAKKLAKIQLKNLKIEIKSKKKEGMNFCYIVKNWIGSPKHLRKGVNYQGYSSFQTNHEIQISLKGKKISEIALFILHNAI
jgi:hypothetical protein